MRYHSYRTSSSRFTAPDRRQHCAAYTRERRVSIFRELVGVYNEDGRVVASPSWRPEPFQVYSARKTNAGVSLIVESIGYHHQSTVQFDRETKSCCQRRVDSKLKNANVYVANSKQDFEKIGTLDEHGEFHVDFGMTSALVSVILRLAPQEDNDGYNLNIVYNLRESCFGL